MKKQLLFCFIGFALLLGFGSHVYAAPITNTSKSVKAAGTTYTWTGAMDVNWSNPGNWQVGGVTQTVNYPGQVITDGVIIGMGVNMPTVDVTIPFLASTEITANTTITALNTLKTNTLLVDAYAALTVSGTALFFMGTTTVSSNAGIITLAGSQSHIDGGLTMQNSAYFRNAGVCTAYQSTISLSMQAYIDNTGGFVDQGGDITFGNDSYIHNEIGGLFEASPLTGAVLVIDMGNLRGEITNNGTITISGTLIKMAPAGVISNTGNGTFTINGNSVIDFGYKSASFSNISNAGAFYAGTSNSPCTINLDYSLARIQNTGLFYLGSTSVINLTQDATGIFNTGPFTLQSDQYGSAAIGNITGVGAQCIGTTYYVERYISGGSPTYRGYRLLSSPVSTTVTPTNYSLNYVTTAPPLIDPILNVSPTTGTNGPAGGFDKIGNPTLYLFRDDVPISNASFTSGNFRGVSDMSAAPNYSIDNDGSGFHIPVGNGFLFFFRGNKTNLATKFIVGASAESVTLSSYGNLNSGQIVTHQWFTPASSTLDYNTISGLSAGFALVGNPYPSAIDWDTFNTTTSTQGIYGGAGLTSFLYMLDPVNQNFSVYEPGVGSTTGVNQNIISSGQGFFVQAADATAQLIFNESAKINTTLQATDNSGNLFFNARINSTVNQAASQAKLLHLKLLKDTTSIDGLIVVFNDNAKPQFDKREDALYKTGSGTASLSCMSSDNIALAINSQALPKLQASIIPLTVNAATDGLYKLNMVSVKNIPALYDIWLKDAYNKDSLDIKHNPTYSFNIYKSDPASFGGSRFSLVIRQNPALGVHLLNFTALKATGGAQVIWKVENEANYTNFSVERSVDNGTTFTAITGFTSNTLGTYGFLDINPVTTVADQYRLKMTDLNGTVTYSNIVVLQYAPLSNNIVSNNVSIYPNPASTVINVSINSGTIATTGPGLPGGGLSYGIKIINITGSVVSTATSTASNWQGNVSTLMPGTYILQVVNSKDQSLVGKSTFIKL